uniref:Pyrin domain-containing protein n=1 Tax=Oreochromis aureus TaxID=47969 RepID=A0A668T2I6_OREAU
LQQTLGWDREKLLGMLEDLTYEEFNNFKWFLQDSDAVVGLPRIPKSRLEKTSTCNLVDLMLQTYTEKSVEVTKKVLKKINRNDLVQKPGKLHTGPSSSRDPEKNHFVDKHRVELIQRVSNIEPILDELLKEKVIQQESYDRIRALQTSQEKMRELYSGPLKAGSASKDVFYQILQTHERLLVNDLLFTKGKC